MNPEFYQRVNKLLILSLGIVTVLFLFSSLSFAGPVSGVKCPAGYETEYNSSYKILKCKKTVTETAATICPDVPYNIYKIREGADKCATITHINVPVTGPLPTGLANELKNVKCMAAPGTTGWQLKTDKEIGPASNQRFRDRCERNKVEYRYPDQL